MLLFVNQAMSTLQQFMQRLLEHYSGAEFHLVVDNAALTIPMERVASSPPLANGSGHSCSRWETQEPSPTRNVEKMTNVPGVASPSFQLRPLGLVSKNASPACPIRKLSPRVHADMEPRGEKIKSTSLNPVETKKPSKGTERLAMSRPPLSPRKKSARASTQGNQKIPQAVTATVTRGRPEILKSPVHALLKPVAPPEEVNPSDLAESWISDEETVAADMPTGGLTRGLSQTLGTDLKEQAPICPTRRPSTQSCDLQVAAVTLNCGHIATKHCDHKQYLRLGRDIVVLPPTPEMRVDPVVSPTSDDRGRRNTDRTHEIASGRNTSESPSLLRGPTGCGPMFVQRRR